MRKDNEHTDMLRDMFARLPKKELPGNFRNDMLGKITSEAVRMKKREERRCLFVTIALAVFFFASGIGALVWLKLPGIEMRVPDLSLVPFFAYIGGLVFILLAVDHKVRKRFYEKHSG